MGSTHNDLIRTLINLADMNATEIAESAGLTPSTVSRFLNHKTDIKSESLISILSSLGINLNQLLKKEIMQRLCGSGSNPVSEDMTIVFQSLSEINQKTLISSVSKDIPETADTEVIQASKRLISYAQSLALRKRRFA